MSKRPSPAFIPIMVIFISAFYTAFLFSAVICINDAHAEPGVMAQGAIFKPGGAYRAYPEVYVSSPDGGEVWTAGQSYGISWTIVNGSSPYKVSIYLSLDGGTSWGTTIVSQTSQLMAGASSFLWSIPTTISNSYTCRIKVTVQDANTDVAVDVSAANFEITHNGPPPPPPAEKPQVVLKSPNGSERWYRGSKYNVNWTITKGVAPHKVSLYISTNSGSSYPYIIVQDYPQAANGSSSYTWSIPATYYLSKTCRLKISVYDKNNNLASNSSKGDFEIANHTGPAPPPPAAKFEVALTSPAGGASFYVGSACDIRWNVLNGTAPFKVTLEYSVTGKNGNFILILADLQNASVYHWTTPAAPTNECCVKVYAEDAKGNFSDETVGSAFRLMALPVQAKGGITGVVTESSSSRAVAGVHIKLYASGSLAIQDTQETQSDGMYLFDGLDAGLYDLNISCTNYSFCSRYSITVTPGNMTVENVALAKTNATAKTADKKSDSPLLGVGWECLAFVALCTVFLIVGLVMLRSVRKKKYDAELYRDAFPGMRGPQALQKHLMKDDIPEPEPEPLPPAAPVYIEAAETEPAAYPQNLQITVERSDEPLPPEPSD